MNVEVAIVLATLLLALLAAGAPVYLALGGSALAVIGIFDLAPLTLLPQQLFSAVHRFTLLAIPLFILAGELLTRAGLSQRIVELADALVGRARGGLGFVTIAASVFFAGMSGSGPADVAALGAILIAPLARAGYRVETAGALVAAGGGIGIIVPPSIALILYGTVADVSISALFVGGVIPGLVVAACLGAAVWWVAPPAAPTGERPPLGRALLRAGWGLAVPVLVLGGIYGGIFTPTEAAAVAALYAALIGGPVLRAIPARELPGILARAGTLSATVMIVVACAALFAWVLTTQGIARGVTDLLAGLSAGSPLRCLLLLNLLLLAAGLVLDAVSIYLVLLPVLLPVIASAGVDPLHFGLVMTVNLALGQITPPVGVNLMVASSISGTPLARLAVASLPFVLAELVALALVSAVPALTTWLPSLMQGR